MVWARTRLLIWDYIFEPVKQIRISYVGRNPDRFYRKVNELVRTTFNVPESYVQEKDYTWEKIRETERFDVGWEVNKVLDTFSYITVEIDLRGFVTEGEGRATIIIKPRLITEYPQDTIWQQSIFYEMLRRVWHKAFYHHRRMEYLNMGKELVVSFESSLKHFAEALRAGEI
ncbi:MAG: hypothetical protein HYY37_06380 [Candidatus Aenigmarchaeota archaeon]|nr:hypothetical protein [Candidatus Aenigmarchaeota archaeon]